MLSYWRQHRKSGGIGSTRRRPLCDESAIFTLSEYVCSFLSFVLPLTSSPLPKSKLLDEEGMRESKYASLTTERLVDLRESKFDDLMREHWSGGAGARALDALLQISGIDGFSHPSDPAQATDTIGTGSDADVSAQTRLQ